MEAGANIGAILVRCILLYYGITFGISLCITSSSRRRHKRPLNEPLCAYLSSSGRQKHDARLRMFPCPGSTSTTTCRGFSLITLITPSNVLRFSPCGIKELRSKVGGASS